VNLSGKQKRILHQLRASGEQPLGNLQHIYDRQRRSLSASLRNLKKAGLIDNPKYGYWQLTEAGLKESDNGC